MPKRYANARGLHVLVALIVVMTLGACGGAAAPAAVPMSDPATYNVTSVQPRTDFIEYYDQEYPFVMTLPRDWFMGQLDMDIYGLVVASTNEPSQERSAITVMVEPASLADGITPSIDGAEASLKAQSGVSGWRVELARPVTVNGIEGQERLYSYDIGGNKLKQRSFYLLEGQQVYAISLTSPQSLYAQHDTLFGDVIASFQGATDTASEQ